MKIGTQKLVYTVENILYENHVKNGRRRIANEIVEAIMELIGEDMNKVWNAAHNFPVELEPIVRRLEKGLSMMLKRDEISAEVYRWLIEQEQEGRKIEKWIEWATADERVKFISQYRSVGVIKAHYKLAFESNEGYNPQQLEIGV